MEIITIIIGVVVVLLLIDKIKQKQKAKIIAERIEKYFANCKAADAFINEAIEFDYDLDPNTPDGLSRSFLPSWHKDLFKRELFFNGVMLLLSTKYNISSSYFISLKNTHVERMLYYYASVAEATKMTFEEQQLYTATRFLDLLSAYEGDLDELKKDDICGLHQNSFK